MLHITSTEHGETNWQVIGHRVVMESFTDYQSTAPAYRMRLDGTTIDIPNGTVGVVYFGEDEERPDLPLVREWFPAHFALWDAVAAAYWDTVAPLPHSRLDALDQVAYDYKTDAWDITELRDVTYQPRHSAEQ